MGSVGHDDDLGDGVYIEVEREVRITTRQGTSVTKQLFCGTVRVPEGDPDALNRALRKATFNQLGADQLGALQADIKAGHPVQVWGWVQSVGRSLAVAGVVEAIKLILRAHGVPLP